MDAKLFTTRDKIRGVAAAWEKAYGPNERRPGWYSSGISDDREATFRKLKELDKETASADEVATIIGNKSWTQLSCDSCGDYVDRIVEIGQEPDYESRTVDICYPCFSKAFALFDCREHADCAAHPETLGRECTRVTLSNSEDTK
jgi:hypothetical protein